MDLSYSVVDIVLGCVCLSVTVFIFGYGLIERDFECVCVFFYI